ncbi:MAG: HAMP domain-containing sensor histidine kinase [Vampirovibrionales bacterium]|nr:HAMP domain-containing sensor histidine kinase [Vampirovibrionales bacterium]
MKTHVNIRRLRLFEQIIVFFVLVLIVPLLGISLLIFNINQNALKKEIRGFTEQAAMGMFQDLVTELHWQRRQANVIQRRVQEAIQSYDDPFNVSETALDRALSGLTPSDIEAIELLDAYGKPLLRCSWHASKWASSTRSLNLQCSKKEHLAYTNNPLLLGNSTPLEATTQARVEWQTPKTPFFHILLPLKAPKTSSAPVKWLLVAQPFPKLSELLLRHQKAFQDAVFLVDTSGTIIAGPPVLVEKKHRLLPSQMAVFKQLTPGIAGEIEARFPILKPKKNQPDSKQHDKALPSTNALHPVEAVILKVPEIDWGLVIQSPYALKQQYIQRARLQSLMLILAMAIGVGILVAGYVLGISRNFRQLIKGIIAMAEGNYTRRIRLISNWLTPYEIVYLSGEFNRMARKTADAWQRVQAANKELEQLDELKSTLIDTVSHELRTPLTNIKGYASRLLRLNEVLDAEARQGSLKRIKVNADRLSRMVDDLLVIPELEQSGLRIFEDHAPLMPLLQNCVQLMLDRESEQPSAPNKPFRQIEIAPADGIDMETLEVTIDPDRLTQVVVNLLDNALKYADPDVLDPIRISISIPNPQQVELVVSNPSRPIKAELLPTLFNKFTRLDESTTRTTRGTGLGLFITRSLINAMGGSISLHCDASCFEVKMLLPLAPISIQK